VKFGWQPPIDRWIPESYAGNTERMSQSYDYAPSIDDYAGTQAYAPGESEEMKMNIAGFGHMTVKQAKEKILDILKDITIAAESDNISSIEQLEHKLFSSPELNNLVKEYAKHIKLLKAKISN